MLLKVQENGRSALLVTVILTQKGNIQNAIIFKTRMYPLLLMASGFFPLYTDSDQYLQN